MATISYCETLDTYTGNLKPVHVVQINPLGPGTKKPGLLAGFLRIQSIVEL